MRRMEEHYKIQYLFEVKKGTTAALLLKSLLHGLKRVGFCFEKIYEFLPQTKKSVFFA
jgi:hypothetical protein